MWAPVLVWTVAENLAPSPGFDPQIAQAVSSRYTDGTTPANIVSWYSFVSGLCWRSLEILGGVHCLTQFVYHSWRHSFYLMKLCNLLFPQDKLLYCPPIDSWVSQPISSLSGLPAYAGFYLLIRATFPPILALAFIIQIIRVCLFSVCNFFQFPVAFFLVSPNIFLSTLCLH